MNCRPWVHKQNTIQTTSRCIRCEPVMCDNGAAPYHTASVSLPSAGDTGMWFNVETETGDWQGWVQSQLMLLVMMRLWCIRTYVSSASRTSKWYQEEVMTSIHFQSLKRRHLLNRFLAAHDCYDTITKCQKCCILYTITSLYYWTNNDV